MLQVDDFDLTVDSPSAAGAASPNLAPQPAGLAAEACANRHTDSSGIIGDRRSGPDATLASTAQWLQTVPSLDTQLDEGASEAQADPSSAPVGATAENAAAETEACDVAAHPTAYQGLEWGRGEASMAAEEPPTAAAAATEERRLTLTAPDGEDACDGEQSHDPCDRQTTLWFPIGQGLPSVQGCRGSQAKLFTPWNTFCSLFSPELSLCPLLKVQTAWRAASAMVQAKRICKKTCPTPVYPCVSPGGAAWHVASATRVHPSLAFLHILLEDICVFSYLRLHSIETL